MLQLQVSGFVIVKEGLQNSVVSKTPVVSLHPTAETSAKGWRHGSKTLQNI